MAQGINVRTAAWCKCDGLRLRPRARVRMDAEDLVLMGVPQSLATPSGSYLSIDHIMGLHTDCGICRNHMELGKCLIRKQVGSGSRN